MSPVVTSDPARGRRQKAAGDRSPSLAGYLGIAASIRDQIASGTLTSGEGIPSEADLMAAHEVARTTVRRALKVLAAEGLIESQQGRGWRVRGEAGSSGPAFAGVVGDLRERIRSGVLPVGERLPSEKDMVVTYACARGTVRRALVELEVEGLIETRPGVGRFVVRSSAAKRSKSKEPGGQ
jgi:DNA-binding GntR family transcriptional regulator